MAHPGKHILARATVEAAIDMVAASSCSLASAACSLDVKRSTLQDAINRTPALRARYEAATEEAAEKLAFEAVEVTDSEANPRRGKVRSDSRRWLASKLHASKFGEKLELQVNTFIDIGTVFEAAKLRKQVYMRAIEGESTRVDGPALPAPKE